MTSPKGATRPVLVLLIVIVLVRIAASFIPSMWLWALNSQRFLGPAGAIALALSALLLFPAFGARCLPAIERVGQAIERPKLPTTLLLMAALGMLVFALPDHTQFTGDFALSQVILQRSADPARLMPQAFPLSSFIHAVLPRGLSGTGLLSASDASRVLGALEATLLVPIAIALCRALDLVGAEAAVLFTAIVFGGALAVFTGTEKAFGELVLLGGIVGVATIRVWRTGRGALVGAIALALALFIHRSALLLLPGAVTGLLLAFRAPRPSGRREAVIGCLLILVAGFLSFPLYAHALQFDLARGYFAAPTVRDELLYTLVDLPNLLILLSPLLLVALVASVRRQMPTPLWVVTALPILGFAAGIRHSTQGLFRDWDILAPAVVPCTALAAAAVAWAMKERGVERWLSAALMAAVIVPTLLWMAAQNSLRGGLAQVRSFLTEGPARPPDVRARGWQFLCGRYVELHRYDDAVIAGRNAASLSPTHDLLTVLAGSEQLAGDLSGALSTYRRVLTTAPGDLVGWYNVARLSAQLGEMPQAFDAVRMLDSLGAPADVVAYTRHLVAAHVPDAPP